MFSRITLLICSAAQRENTLELQVRFHQVEAERQSDDDEDEPSLADDKADPTAGTLLQAELSPCVCMCLTNRDVTGLQLMTPSTAGPDDGAVNGILHISRV